MSDIESNIGGLTGDADTEANAKGKAKALVDQAGKAIKGEAQSFAGMAQERARTEAQKHTESATKTLGDFANAVRKAGDELGQSDQTPAAKLVRHAADGLEGLSRNLSGKQPEDLLDDVRSFGRKNPIAFIGGAVLVGVALGRFIRATETPPPKRIRARPLRAPTTHEETLAEVVEEGFRAGPEFAAERAGDIGGAPGTDLTPGAPRRPRARRTPRSS